MTRIIRSNVAGRVRSATVHYLCEDGYLILSFAYQNQVSIPFARRSCKLFHNVAEVQDWLLQWRDKCSRSGFVAEVRQPDLSPDYR